MRNNTKQQGFTLIELIVVIVILGILAVTAAPKFINFTADARASTVKGVEGALKGAALIVYSKEAISGKEATSNAAGASGSGIATTFGYPAATKAALDDAGGISSATDGSAEFTIIVNSTPTPNIVYYYPASIYNATTPLAAATVEAGNCYAKYTEATSATVGPVILSVVTGCES